MPKSTGPPYSHRASSRRLCGCHAWHKRKPSARAHGKQDIGGPCKILARGTLGHLDFGALWCSMLSIWLWWNAGRLFGSVTPIGARRVHRLPSVRDARLPESAPLSARWDTVVTTSLPGASLLHRNVSLSRETVFGLRPRRALRSTALSCVIRDFDTYLLPTTTQRAWRLLDYTTFKQSGKSV